MAKSKRSIVLTGGGSIGHVSVNLALIPRLVKDGWDIHYIGSHDGIEKEVIEPLAHVSYRSISSGKLRRYFSVENAKDILNVLTGLYESYQLIKRLKPHVVFSKGGFVSVPVVIGAWLHRIPVISHESDVSPGLASKINARFSKKVCLTFSEAKTALPVEKVIEVGPIIREEVFRGQPSIGKNLTSFKVDKPIILIMGGSLGSEKINQAVRDSLPSLLHRFNIIHLCGKHNVDSSYSTDGYIQFEFVNEELPHLYSITDLVVSRAGSNAIFEFKALEIPMILIPLSEKASRGDQIQNASLFRWKGFAEVISEEALTEQVLISTIDSVYIQLNKYKEKLKKEASSSNSLERLYELIDVHTLE